MKKIYVMAMAMVAMSVMTGCRSSKDLTDANSVADPAQMVQEVSGNALTYTDPRRTQTPAQRNPIVVGAGDRQENVTLVNSADAGKLRDYNVVVGAFGSKTNAENFKNVMSGRGYNAFLVQNPQGLFRVVAAGFDSREQAVQTRDQIRSTYANDDPGTCPAAWILIPRQ